MVFLEDMYQFHMRACSFAYRGKDICLYITISSPIMDNFLSILSCPILLMNRAVSIVTAPIVPNWLPPRTHIGRFNFPTSGGV